MTRKKVLDEKKPEFKDFSSIIVPIGPVRMELALIQKEGIEEMSLSEFLLLVHRCVLEAKNA